MSEVVTNSAAVEFIEEDTIESQRVLVRSERGMISAEWAVGIIAAIAIAGVLLAVVTNGKVEDALLTFILFVINGFSGMMGR
jgi:hypothetical protein